MLTLPGIWFHVRMPRTRRTSPRRAPLQARAQDTIDVLLDATEIVLSRSGFRAATTNRIAEKAGVSIGTLYRYFPSTEALVAAVVHRMWARELDVLEARVAEVANEPLDAAVAALVSTLV